MSLEKDLSRARNLYNKGKHMEVCLYTFMTLSQIYGYDKEPEILNAIKNKVFDLLVVVGIERSTGVEKKIARELLNLAYGNERVNSAINKIAIVEDRNDPLVRKWRNRCMQRDGFKCRACDEDKKLCVHHISYWSDDPSNRINEDNGITLCKACHKKEHEDDWFANFI